jgi:hypothetical protein
MGRRKTFPLGYNDALETAKFKARVNEYYWPKLQYLHRSLEIDRRVGTRPSFNALLEVQRVGWEYLTLYFAGLPPKEKNKFADELVPWWINYKAVRAKTLALAEQALAEMGAEGRL